jgi:hypothetical protein
MLFTLVYSTPFKVRLVPGQTATAYTAGKTIGGLMALPAPTPINSGSVGPVILIESALFSDAEMQDGDFDLVLFDSLPTDPGDNAAYNPSTADLEKVAGVIEVRAATGDWTDFSANSVAKKKALALTVPQESRPNIYGLLVARSAITWAGAGSLKAKLTGFVN